MLAREHHRGGAELFYNRRTGDADAWAQRVAPINRRVAEGGVEIDRPHATYGGPPTARCALLALRGLDAARDGDGENEGIPPLLGCARAVRDTRRPCWS